MTTKLSMRNGCNACNATSSRHERLENMQRLALEKSPRARARLLQVLQVLHFDKYINISIGYRCNSSATAATLDLACVRRAARLLLANELPETWPVKNLGILA